MAPELAGFGALGAQVGALAGHIKGGGGNCCWAHLHGAVWHGRLSYEPRWQHPLSHMPLCCCVLWRSAAEIPCPAGAVCWCPLLAA